MEENNLKKIIYNCIDIILKREKKEYVKLNEIYEEVANYLEVENKSSLQSQIRGRLQEGCEQYQAYVGEPLFKTEKIRSGNWTIIPKVKKYIRYNHNHYLVSDDNWRTHSKIDQISNEYIIEENADYIYKAKLQEKIGIHKSNIIYNELLSIRKMTKRKDFEDVGFGLSFEIFAISVLYNLEYEDSYLNYIIQTDTSEGTDGGIDAIYYGDAENIYIYQIKLNFIEDNAYEKMNESYLQCKNNKTPKDGQSLFKFFTKNKAQFERKKLNFCSVSNNSKKETNTTPDQIYELFFQNKLLPTDNNNLILTIHKPIIQNDGLNQYNVSTDTNNNFNLYLSAEKLISYLLDSLKISKTNYDCQKIDITKFFTDNVRGTLNMNQKMIFTIENEPENFVKYNNGINITGEVKDLGDRIEIKNPVINNGQQTITTLIRYNKNLNKITLPIKITNEKDMKIKGKISKFSNDQVKVKPIDMLSLDPYIRKIQYDLYQHKFQENSYFLKIYSSGKKSYDNIIEELYEEENIISLLDFIKLYYSCENKEDLGAWKNSPNYQIEQTNINDYFNLNKSFKVCKAISDYSKFIKQIDNRKEKDDYKSADLAFKYLLCQENLTIKEACHIIQKINQKYYYNVKDEKSKLIDIYKSTNIINKIEMELNKIKQNN